MSISPKTPDTLKNQVPDDDFELIAKYVYARMAEYNSDMKRLEAGEYYANAKKGLHSLFITNYERLYNLNINREEQDFIDKNLGFSHYVNDEFLCHFFFVNFGDYLIKNKGSKTIFFDKENNLINKDLKNISDNIIDALNNIISKNIYVQNKNERIKKLLSNRSGNDNDLLFLFDFIYLHDDIDTYLKTFDEEFEQIKTLINTHNKDAYFIYYLILFYGMKLIKRDFFYDWKRYTEMERYYKSLKKRAHVFNELLKPHFKNIESGLMKKHHIPIMYLISKLIRSISTSNEFSKFLSGGKATINHATFINKVNCLFDIVKSTKYFINSKIISEKRKSDNSSKEYKDKYNKNNINFIEKRCKKFRHISDINFFMLAL